MSDKPISKGDLVINILPASCCGSTKGIGVTFVVQKISRIDAICKCGDRKPNLLIAFREDGLWGSVYRLKRLDPGNLSEDVPTGEKVSA